MFTITTTLGFVTQLKKFVYDKVNIVEKKIFKT
jgi:hypothetical protein